MPATKHQQTAPPHVREKRSRIMRAAKAAGATHDDVRAYCGRAFGVTGLRQLTEPELDLAVRHWNGERARQAETGRGPRTNGRYVGRGERGAAAFLTPKQADYVAGLEQQLGWDWGGSPFGSPQLQAFVRRQLGVGDGVHTKIESLRRRQATKLITGLKALLADRPE